MRAAPRIDLGGRPPPTMDLNISYCLWAIMTAAVLLAGFSLIANLWIYVFNAIGSVYGWPVMYPDMNHARWLFASGLLSVIGGAAFWFVRAKMLRDASEPRQTPSPPVSAVRAREKIFWAAGPR